MSLSTLPTECIELILKELQEQYDVQSLSHLLLVNRNLCSMTLPYFYSTAIEERSDIDHFALLQLLLRQRPPKDVSPLLSAAFDVFPDEPAGTTSPSEEDHSWTPTSTRVHIDYLKYVRSFDFEDAIFDHMRRRGCTSRLLTMAFTSKTGEVAHAYGEGGLDASLPFPPSIITEGLDMERVRQCAVATALRRDLTWTLCTPFLEQVRSMFIPLSDIGRYIPLLVRFKSLASVDFKMDESLEFSGDLTEVDPDVAIELEQCRERRKQQFKDMLLFVRKHIELYPDVLQRVDCPKDRRWEGEEIKCPFEIRDELLWLLQSRKELWEVNTSNWGLVTRKIHEVDLGSVEMFDLQAFSEDESGHASDVLSGHPPLLSRCRSLKQLHLGTMGDSFSFKWAVDEKLASNRRRALDHTSDSVDKSATIALSKELQLAPIPLEGIAVPIPSSPHTRLDDIVFAFGDTLKGITARTTVADGNTEDIPSLRVGQGWSLPRIHTVSINSDDVQLLIDPGLLRGMSENMESIELIDKSGRHQCRDLGLISPPSNPLLRLHTISLHGQPAIQFHPDTLLMTMSLENLFLGTEFDAGMEQESLEESEVTQQDILSPDSHISRWTWNWNLPSLDCLFLDGKFAQHFSFRMLESCPSLKRLQLDLQGESRALELQDLMSTVSKTRPTGDGSFTQRKEVISSLVEHLSLGGTWKMSDEVLATLFSTVFSKMLWLREYQTSGYSLRGWLAALKGHGRLKGAHCGLPRLGDDEMTVDGMGLASKPRPAIHYKDGGEEVFDDEEHLPLFFFTGRKAWYYEKESN